jgi:hypothetical protein
MGLISQANVLARIGALAGIYDIDISAMHAALGTLGPDLAQGTLVTVPITFDRLGVTTRVVREQLDQICDATQLERIDRLAAPSHAYELELESGGPLLARTVHIGGGRDIEADLTQLSAFGVERATVETLRACTSELGMPRAIADRDEKVASSWRFEVRHPNSTPGERDITRRRLAAVARMLSVTTAQMNLVEGVHDMLAKDRDSDSVLFIGADGAPPRLAVRWRRVRWESAIRIALNFAPTVDVGRKMGELSGAFAAEAAESVELVLGPKEPPLMRVTVAFV